MVLGRRAEPGRLTCIRLANRGDICVCFVLATPGQGQRLRRSWRASCDRTEPANPTVGGSGADGRRVQRGWRTPRALVRRRPRKIRRSWTSPTIEKVPGEICSCLAVIRLYGVVGRWTGFLAWPSPSFGSADLRQGRTRIVAGLLASVARLRYRIRGRLPEPGAPRLWSNVSIGGVQCPDLEPFAPESFPP